MGLVSYARDFTLTCRLRMRSPFSLTTVLMVGARVRDGGGKRSLWNLLTQRSRQRSANSLPRTRSENRSGILSA